MILQGFLSLFQSTSDYLNRKSTIFFLIFFLFSSNIRSVSKATLSLRFLHQNNWLFFLSADIYNFVASFEFWCVQVLATHLLGNLNWALIPINICEKTQMDILFDLLHGNLMALLWIREWRINFLIIIRILI